MDPSAAIYTNFILSIYDIFVLGFSSTFAWRCPTSTVLLPFFRRHVGANAHMDIGVGTGYYTAESVRELSTTRTVALVDLNPNSLRMTEERLVKAGYRGNVESIRHNIFTPLPPSLHGKFDAVSMFYLLHCLSGECTEKTDKLLENLVPALTPDGLVYGTTILGKGVTHNLLGRILMWFYNSKGVFGNAEDTKEGFEEALHIHFEEVETRVVGIVLLFTARRPKRHCKHTGQRSRLIPLTHL